MSPKLLTRRGQVMKRQHLQDKWHDDTQGACIDQNLGGGKPEHAENLQNLRGIVRNGGCERGQTTPVAYLANASVQLPSSTRVQAVNPRTYLRVFAANKLAQIHRRRRLRRPQASKRRRGGHSRAQARSQ